MISTDSTRTQCSIQGASCLSLLSQLILRAPHRQVQNASANGLSHSLRKYAADAREEHTAPQPSTIRNWIQRLRHARHSCKVSLAHHHKRPLHAMKYTVFGVGDSVYLTFNAMGKFVDIKLKQLGALRFHAVGLGDCSGDLDGEFKSWQAGLLRKIPLQASISQLTGINFASALATVTYGRLRSRQAISVLPTSRATEKKSPEKLRLSSSTSRPSSRTKPQAQDNAAVPLRRSPLMTTSIAVRDNFGRNVHVRFRVVLLEGEGILCTPVGTQPKGPRTPRAALFDTKPFAEIIPVEAIGFSSPHSDAKPSRQRSSGIFRVHVLNPEVTFSTVSTLAIFPQNNPVDVEVIAQAFDFDLEAIIKLEIEESLYQDRQTELHALQQQIPFPTPCTVRTALTEYLELATVTREFVRVASGFVVTSDERDLLESLSSSDGSSAFQTQIQDQHKGITDIIAMAPTLQIPLNVFVNITRTIKPRYFTIASSPRVSERHLDLAVALGNPAYPRGLAASFFHRILVSEYVNPICLRGFVSGSRFQFEDDGISPMVFITTGVGFTAMRAIIQDRLAKWRGVPETANHVLFLGSASEDAVVFRGDLLRWEQQLVLKVRFAFPTTEGTQDAMCKMWLPAAWMRLCKS